VVHIPLIIKFPGGRHAGASTEQLVASIDIAPTILAELGSDAPPDWEGSSVLDFIGPGAVRAPRKTIVIEAAEREEISIRSGGWMYREIRAEFRDQQDVQNYLGFGEGVRELYDLTRNPAEDRNVYPDGRASLLLQRLKTFESLVPLDGLRLENEEHLRALRALGYIR
jgi:arylsulfatase A-like enzyme